MNFFKHSNSASMPSLYKKYHYKSDGTLYRIVFCDTDAYGTFIHRDNDKPAIIYRNGRKEWFLIGKEHRDLENGPAIITENGIKVWMTHGELNKNNAYPVIEKPDGTRFSYNELSISDKKNLNALF